MYPRKTVFSSGFCYFFIDNGEKMHPIAFHIGSFDVHWYGVFIGIGFLASFGLLMKIRKYASLTVDQVYNISMIALFAGVVGARLFYVIQFWNDHFAGKGILNMLNVHNGGLVFYGGFILAFTAECVYAKWPAIRLRLGMEEKVSAAAEPLKGKESADNAEPRKNISLLALLDILGPAMALAHAFGRISCFMEGCCYGKPAPDWFPLAVRFPDKAQASKAFYSTISDGPMPVYPVQLFESAGNLLMCGILLLLLRKRKYAGTVGAVYLVLYGVMRFLLEFMRGDHDPNDFILGLTPSQFIAVALAIPGGVILYRIALKRGQEKNKEAADA